MAESLEIGRDGVSRRRVTKSDFDHLADFIIEEHIRRRKDREELEDQWKEIDRQVRMEPDRKFKTLKGGKADPAKAWMSETELPLQSQALEILVSDTRRFLFPGNGQWFRAHAKVTDDYLDKVDFQSLIAGDKTEVPSQIDQVDADGLVRGFLGHLHQQYDFRQNVDKITAESLKYGVGVGRARTVTKEVFVNTAKGTVKKKTPIPMLLPRTIRNTFLDDRLSNVMHTGSFSGPSVIYEETWSYDDLAIAIKKGSRNPDDENGGWIQSGFKQVEPPQDRQVKVLEYEGDIVFPRKTARSLFIPNAIVTVVVGDKKVDRSTRAVVRLRFRKQPWSSYIEFPYHHEDLNTPYAVGPLQKGRPVQKAAGFVLNRIADAAMIQLAPPVGWDHNDPSLAAQGGPNIEPFTTWRTTDPASIAVFDKVGGNPATLTQIYVALLTLYADVTGVNAPRLGAQTVSHTTAFAKDVELQRGAARTVDYARSMGVGPLSKWLSMAYEMGRETVRETEIYIDDWQAWVKIGKDILPEQAEFEWLGATGPSEESARMQQRFSSANLALQIDAQNIQLGGQPILSRPALIKEALREGGWTDVDIITDSAVAAEGDEAASGVAGADQVDPEAISAALSEVAG